jgi:hypothetical protein
MSAEEKLEIMSAKIDRLESLIETLTAKVTGTLLINNKGKEKDRKLTCKETMEYFGISRTTLDSWVLKQILTPYVIFTDGKGKQKKYFKLSELEEVGKRREIRLSRINKKKIA